MQSEFTQAEVIEVRALLATFANTTPLTAANFQQQAQIANASWKSPADYQSYTASATTLEVERRGKFNWVKVQGITAEVTITTITHSGINPFQEGDTIQVQSVPGYHINMMLPGMAVGVKLTDATKFVEYTLTGGAWHVTSSNPSIASVPVRPLEHVIITSPELPVYAGSVAVKYYTGEVKATGNVTITVAGVSGSVSAYVDEGFGTLLLGTYSYSGSPTTSAVASGLEADIQARLAVLQHEYDALAVANVVNIIVPDGRGSAADVYVISSVDTGDAVSIVAGFGVINGGTDAINGAEANGTVETITTPATDGAIIEITNEMAANTLLLDSSAIPTSFLTSKTLQAKETGRLKYIGTLAAWSQIV